MLILLKKRPTEAMTGIVTMLALTGIASATEVHQQGGQQYTMPFATIGSSGGQIFDDGSMAIIGQPLVGTISNDDYTMIVGALPGLFSVEPPLPEPGGPPCSVDGDCTGGWAGALCVSGACYVPKNRYISFMPNNSGRQTKLKVTLSASLPHSGLIGSYWWVQAPIVTVPGVSPKPLVGPDECVAVLGPQATAADIDWVSAGCTTLHVTGCPIEPTSDYDVRAVAVAFASAPLSVPTILRPGGAKWWGDTVGIFNGIEWTPPQGASNIDDVVVAVKTWQGGQVVAPVPGSNVAHLAVADVEPAAINMIVNFGDVQRLIIAFKGAMYNFGPADADANCP